MKKDNKTKLKDADLRSVNLRNACLLEAQLENSDLCGAHLEGVNLRFANLSFSNLHGTDLRGVDISMLIFTTPEAKKMIAELRKQQTKAWRRKWLSKCIAEGDAEGRSLASPGPKKKLEEFDKPQLAE